MSERTLTRVLGHWARHLWTTVVSPKFVVRRRHKAVLELAGKLEWDAGYDHKKERIR